MQYVTITAAFIGMALLGPVVAIFSLPPAQQGALLVLSPPWIDRDAAIRQAGGRGTGPLTTRLASLAQADDPGFGDRLRGMGPFLVLNGDAVLTLCGASG